MEKPILTLSPTGGITLKIGVTGGYGFIGSYLPEDWTKINMDVRKIKPRDVKDFDCIVHLAALTSVDESFISPVRYFDNNVAGTSNILKCCLKHNVRVVFASSSGIGFSESFDKTSPYMQTKMMGEALCDYYNKAGLSTIILRFHNVYGKGCKGVIYNFLNCREPYITGHGRQGRDFVHVKDVANAIEAATVFGKSCKPYEIGTGVETTVIELAYLMGLQDKVKHVGARPNEIEEVVADNRETKADLQWTPQITLKEGLKILNEE